MSRLHFDVDCVSYSVVVKLDNSCPYFGQALYARLDPALFRDRASGMSALYCLAFWLHIAAPLMVVVNRSTSYEVRIDEFSHASYQ